MATSTRTGGRDATTAVVPGRYALSIGDPELPLPEDWRWTKLTDVARLESGHTPSRKEPDYWDGGVPWIGIKDATQNHGRVIPDTLQHVSDLGIANSSARMLPEHTVCLSRTASVGYVVVMGQSMATSQDFVNWVCSDRLDWRFLKYVLVAERGALLRYAHGTTHQTIYFPEAKAFHVALPSIEEQRAIASVLGALDDKIESNRAIEDLCHELALTEFSGRFGRGWQGAHTTGAAPKVGEWGDVGDICELRYGKALKAESRAGGPVAVVGSSGEVGRHDEVFVQGPVVVVGRKGVAGSVLWIDDDAWPIDTTFYVAPNNGFPMTWVYGALLGASLPGAGGDSAVPGLNRDAALARPAVIPPLAACKEFDELARPLMRKRAAARAECAVLSDIRDALLPKLVSGKIRVPLDSDPEKQAA